MKKVNQKEKCPKCGEEKLAYQMTFARDLGPIKPEASGAVYCYEPGCGEVLNMKYLDIRELAENIKIYWVGGVELCDLVREGKLIPHPSTISMYPIHGHVQK